MRFIPGQNQTFADNHAGSSVPNIANPDRYILASTHQTIAGNVTRFPNKIYPNIFAQIEGSVACVGDNAALNVSAQTAGAVLPRVQWKAGQ